MDSVLSVLGYLGAIVVLATLTIALIAIANSLRRPAEQAEGRARQLLTTPVILASTVAFAGATVLLWHPLPSAPPVWLRLALAWTGFALIVAGAGLYLWGLTALGSLFAPSSALGVRLQAGHQLITGGAFACVRHPMYLGVLAICLGALLLYLTWACLFLLVSMLGLLFRARREERVLEALYGDAWRDYAKRVPAWLPRLKMSRPGAWP